MANKARSTSTQPSQKSWWFATSIWFILALLTAAAAAVLWMALPTPVANSADEALEAPTQEAAAFDIGTVSRIDELNDLENEVQPVSFEALVRDLRDYPPEFVDSGYLKRYRGKWTVQVMDVAEHDIVTDYLKLREDRDKFAYFRYRDSDNQVRYLVMYGRMNSAQEAKNTANSVDFNLPKNVTVLPEKIDTYKDIIENYELSLPVEDISVNRPRRVKLQPTKRQLAAKRRTPKPSSKSSSESSSKSSSNSEKRSDSKTTNSNPLTSTNRPEPARRIESSNDTSATLSVNEQRNVETVAPSSSTQPTQQSTPAEPAKPKPAEQPAKPTAPSEPVPPPAKPTEPVPPPKSLKDTPAPPPLTPSAKPNDSIAELIEDRS